MYCCIFLLPFVYLCNILELFTIQGSLAIVLIVKHKISNTWQGCVYFEKWNALSPQQRTTITKQQ